MNFRVAIVGHRPIEPNVLEALLIQVEQDTSVDRGKLEARLAEPSPWLVDLDSPESAEALREHWEAILQVHLTVYPLRGPVEPVPTPAGPWSAPTVMLAAGSRVTADAPSPPPAPSAPPVEAPAEAFRTVSEPPVAAPAASAPPAPGPTRPQTRKAPGNPNLLRPGRVLDMRIQAPPKQTSRLFLVFLVVGGFAAWKTWRDWYTERAVGGLRGSLGSHCAVGPGHYSFGPDENIKRFERGDVSGRCNADVRTNPMGCDPPILLNGARTLMVGQMGSVDLVLALPTGVDSELGPGTYEVRGVSEDSVSSMSNRPRCPGWTGAVTIDSLTWQERPRATSHARWEVRDLSVRWDLGCTSGAQTRFSGCYSYGADAP